MATRRKPTLPRARVVRSKKTKRSAAAEESAFVKWRDSDRKARGFAPNTAPDDFSLDAAIEARIATYVTEAREAFAASNAVAKAIGELGAQIKPLLAEVRQELGLHRRRITDLEDGHAKHTVRLDDHHERLTALEQRAATKGQEP